MWLKNFKISASIAKHAELICQLIFMINAVFNLNMKKQNFGFMLL